MTYTNMGSSNRDENGAIYIPHTLSNFEGGITKVVDLGGTGEMVDVVFDKSDVADDLRGVGVISSFNAGQIFVFTNRAFETTLALLDTDDTYYPILKFGDVLNIDGMNQSIVEIELTDDAVNGSFIAPIFTLKDETGIFSEIVGLLELQSAVPPGGRLPTADLSLSDLEYGATDLVATLDATLSRDNDDINGTDQNGIAGVMWSIIDEGTAAFPREKLIFSSEERIVDVPIEQSGLIHTGDSQKVVLEVSDNDDPELVGDRFEALLSYNNVAPSIRALTVSPDIRRGGVLLEAFIEDPDLAVNGRIRALEGVDTLFGINSAEKSLYNSDAAPSFTARATFPTNLIFPPETTTTQLNVFVNDLHADGDPLSVELNEEAVLSGRALVFFTGSPVSVSQEIPAVPVLPFTFQFDYLFSDMEGMLEVFLNDTVLISLNGADYPNDLFSTAFIPIYGDLLGLTDATLTFTFDGPSGLELLLDNIIFPGLLNGDFDGGLSDSWTVVTQDEFASAEVQDFILNPPPTPKVPEPASLALFAIGLAGLGYVRSQRKAA